MDFLPEEQGLLPLHA